MVLYSSRSCFSFLKRGKSVDVDINRAKELIDETLADAPIALYIRRKVQKEQVWSFY
jgi:hypothetical protein